MSPKHNVSQQEKSSQPLEDDSTPELQIVNVCSLSSVMNMYLPEEETVENSNVIDESSSSSPHGNKNATDKHDSIIHNITAPTQTDEVATRKSTPVASTSTYSQSVLHPTSSVSTSKSSQNTNEETKTSESVVLKISNLNSRKPVVSSVTTSSAKISLPQEQISGKGRIKVKSFKDLMAKPTDEVLISENVSTLSSVDKTSIGHRKENIPSELKITSSFSINEKDEEKNIKDGEGDHGFHAEKDDLTTNTSEITHKKQEQRNEEEGNKDSKDNIENKTIKTDLECSSANEIETKESIREMKSKNEVSLANFKEEGDESFDKDDCYICMDCQPLKLLNGLGLTRHCINNPTHFQINHLADFNKFDLPLNKLSKSTVEHYFSRLANERKRIEQSNIYASQSSIDSGSSDCWSDSSSVVRRRRKKRLENKRYFESSDTATDDDLSQDKQYHRGRKK